MKLLVLSNLQPHSGHTVRAANVVVFELLRALADEAGVQCGFLRVTAEGAVGASEAELDGHRALRSAGVEVLPPLSLPIEPPARMRERLGVGGISAFYPQVKHANLVGAAIESFRPDAIFIPWCEWLTALCAELPVTKFAYYGNPDAKSARARLQFARRHGDVRLLPMAIQAWDNRQLERAHLGQMMKYDLVGDVAANDADYYARRGHPNAFYVRNVWIDRYSGGSWRAPRREKERGNVIIGNVGRLPGTANTLGLEILGRDLLPRLRERMGDASYRVRILGAGTLHRHIESHFRRPEIEMAGFVPDIDEAMMEAGIFLCVNNASAYKVGHTRYLHAWSLGGCVVAHRDAALSMPEIRHNENALLGDTMAEIVDLLAVAMADAPLRRRIGEAGYETFTNLFMASSVAASIVERIRALGQAHPRVGAQIIAPPIAV
jgi:hypothetical protein